MNTDPLTTSASRIREPELAPFQIAKHAALFLLTLLTTMIAGMLWQNDTDLIHISKGIPYAVSLLFILSCHEFGHYFAARHHGVRATLPYFIPAPPLDIIAFGTFGAVIRTKSPSPNRAVMFDIGIAGPLAGFCASVLILAIGFMTLPGRDFLLAIHPGYDFATGTIPGLPHGSTVTFGSTMLYDALAALFAKPGAYLPPMSEMYHYPLLITGWFGLLVTALNLLPAGQLDGGHIVYAMFGKRHRIIARLTLALIFINGLVGVLPYVAAYAGAPELTEAAMETIPEFSRYFWPGWLFWGFMILFLIKIDHPPIADETPLDDRRMLLGWCSALMLLLCICPAPIFLA